MSGGSGVGLTGQSLPNLRVGAIGGILGQGPLIGSSGDDMLPWNASAMVARKSQNRKAGWSGEVPAFAQERIMLPVFRRRLCRNPPKATGVLAGSRLA